MYGKKVVVETRVRRDAEPFLDIGRYLCPSRLRRASCVRQGFCKYSRGQLKGLAFRGFTLAFTQNGQIMLGFMTTCDA